VHSPEILHSPYHNADARGQAAQHCVDYKRGKQLIKVLAGSGAPPLLRTRTLDAAGAILAMFWASLGEDLLTVEDYHRELLQSLAVRFHTLQQCIRLNFPHSIVSKAPEVAQLLLDYNFCITFAVANIRAVEKLSKKLSKVAKFPLKDAILLHALQTLPFARAVVPAAVVEHLNVLLLMFQDAMAADRSIRLPLPLNDALIAAASTITCGGCSSHMPSVHMVLACGHTRCPSCYALCRKLGMTKLISQRHNLKDFRHGPLLKANDISVILCDSCAHTFVASSDECQPTHAAAAYLSSRCISKHPHITRQHARSTAKGQRLQGNGRAFDEEVEEDLAGGSSDNGDVCTKASGPSSSASKKKDKGSGLSEAAFYMSLGESDAGDGAEARACIADCSVAESTMLEFDDSFNDIDGTSARLYAFLL
jgi:hypothetical protein